jgi:uncharacterized protein
MRWSRGDRSNIEDLRGRSGGMGIPIGIGGFILLALLSFATGTDFLSLVTGGGSTPQSAGTSGAVASSPEEEKLVDFVDATMADVQATWQRILPDRYQPTRAVLFRDAIDSACGFAQSATGPFYCPRDGLVYLDLGFFDEMRRRFGAPGDFAQAYVLAHEVGHHVQRLTGIEARVRSAQAGDPRGANAMSVRLELQADCFAGVWGAHAGQSGRVALEGGDVEEGLNAASAIGDDRLQRMAGGRVAPERFTHGTSAQRVEWFTRGMKTGDPEACDTFGAGTAR